MILKKKYFVTIAGGKKINSKREKLITLQKKNEHALHDFGGLLESVIDEYYEHKRQKGLPRRRVLHPIYEHLNDSYYSYKYISKVSEMCAENNVNIEDFTFAEALELNQFMLFSPILIKLEEPNENNKHLFRISYYWNGLFRIDEYYKDYSFELNNYGNYYGQGVIFAKALADTGRVKEDFISVLADFNRADCLSVVFDNEEENTNMDNFIHLLKEEKFDNSIPVTFLYNLYGLENCKVRKDSAAESSISDIAEIVKFYKYTTQKR